MGKFIQAKALLIYVAAGFIGLLTFQNCSSKLQSNLTEQSSVGGLQTMTCYTNPNAVECRSCGTKPADDFNYAKCPNSNAMAAQQMFTYVCNPSSQMYDRMPFGQLNTSACSSQCTGAYPGGRRQVACPAGQNGVAYQEFISSCNSSTGQWSQPIASGNPDNSGCMAGGGACSNGATNPPSCTTCPSGQTMNNQTCTSTNTVTCQAGSSTLGSARNAAGQDQICRFDWSLVTTTTTQQVPITGTPAGQMVRSCGPGGWTVISQTCPPPGVSAVNCPALTETQLSGNAQRTCKYSLLSTPYVAGSSTSSSVAGVNQTNNQAINGAIMYATCGSNGVWTNKSKVCPNPVKCPARVPPAKESIANNTGVKHSCTYSLPETEFIGAGTTPIDVTGTTVVNKTGTASGLVTTPGVASVTGKCNSDGTWTDPVVTTCNPPANVNTPKCVASSGHTQLSEANNVGNKRTCFFTWEAKDINPDFRWLFKGRDRTTGLPDTEQGTLEMRCIQDPADATRAKWDVPGTTYPATCPKLPDVIKCEAGNNAANLTPSAPNNAGTTQSCYFEWTATEVNPNVVRRFQGRIGGPGGATAQGSEVSGTCVIDTASGGTTGTWINVGAFCPKPNDVNVQLQKCAAMNTTGAVVTNAQGASRTCSYSIPEHQLTQAEVTAGGFNLPPVNGTPGGTMAAKCNTNGTWTFTETPNSCPAPALVPATCRGQTDLPLRCSINRMCRDGSQLVNSFVGDVYAEIIISSPYPTAPVLNWRATPTNLIVRKYDGKTWNDASGNPTIRLDAGYGGVTYQCTAAANSTTGTWNMTVGGFCNVSFNDPDAECAPYESPGGGG